MRMIMDIPAVASSAAELEESGLAKTSTVKKMRDLTAKPAN